MHSVMNLSAVFSCWIVCSINTKKNITDFHQTLRTVTYNLQNAAKHFSFQVMSSMNYNSIFHQILAQNGFRSATQRVSNMTYARM